MKDLNEEAFTHLIVIPPRQVIYSFLKFNVAFFNS